MSDTYKITNFVDEEEDSFTFATSGRPCTETFLVCQRHISMVSTTIKKCLLLSTIFIIFIVLPLLRRL